MLSWRHGSDASCPPRSHHMCSEDFAWYLLILGEISRPNRCHCCRWLLYCRYAARNTDSSHADTVAEQFVDICVRVPQVQIPGKAVPGNCDASVASRISQLSLPLRCGPTPHLGCRELLKFACLRSQLPGDAGSEPSGFFVGVCLSLFIPGRAGSRSDRGWRDRRHRESLRWTCVQVALACILIWFPFFWLHGLTWLRLMAGEPSVAVGAVRLRLLPSSVLHHVSGIFLLGQRFCLGAGRCIMEGLFFWVFFFLGGVFFLVLFLGFFLRENSSFLTFWTIFLGFPTKKHEGKSRTRLCFFRRKTKENHTKSVKNVRKLVFSLGKTKEKHTKKKKDTPKKSTLSHNPTMPHIGQCDDWRLRLDFGRVLRGSGRARGSGS